MASRGVQASSDAATLASNAQITVSVISHGQGDLVLPLLQQLAELEGEIALRVIVTENLPASVGAFKPTALPLYDALIVNPEPKGFGENHNAAFANCDTPFFCVINPDIRLGPVEPFSALVAALQRASGVAAPCVRNSTGGLEDSARQVPTLWRLARRAILRKREADYAPGGAEKTVDWVAGMLMLFDVEVFRRLGGFDERFHLYCEDVDICLRTHLEGFTVHWVTAACVLHDAQRDSRRKWKYLAWHVESMTRLFLSRSYSAFLRQRAGARQAAT
ncbi:hypothetical protein Cmtc_22080 [Cupriavidus sp. TKC]|uniref:glycosyltransferase n=1 Tax=unclassified Cupriavidus TaxID=2640874 RepID=UPI0002A321C0|nr:MULTISPECIES: glycosyltransferase [unclassified Cupriavidus]ELA00680.1 glycosyl transferase family protein [Cupriavidus sp. HMR-1]GMG90988.1 hypothetical protein Cmtc_22080 [Cupriavidus sp. TKC]